MWNAAYSHRQFWDGRASDLEDQAQNPIQSKDEMNQDPTELVKELRAIPEYVALFDEAFGGRGGSAVTFENTTRAIAAFERTLVSNALALRSLSRRRRRGPLGLRATRARPLPLAQDPLLRVPRLPDLREPRLQGGGSARPAGAEAGPRARGSGGGARLRSSVQDPHPAQRRPHRTLHAQREVQDAAGGRALLSEGRGSGRGPRAQEPRRQDPPLLPERGRAEGPHRVPGLAHRRVGAAPRFRTACPRACPWCRGSATDARPSPPNPRPRPQEAAARTATVWTVKAGPVHPGRARSGPTGRHRRGRARPLQGAGPGGHRRHHAAGQERRRGPRGARRRQRADRRGDRLGPRVHHRRLRHPRLHEQRHHRPWRHQGGLQGPRGRRTRASTASTPSSARTCWSAGSRPPGSATPPSTWGSRATSW